MSKQPNSNTKPKIFVIVPIGIPGMGKTCFKDIFQESAKEINANVICVSSDKIRRQCMDKLAQKKKGLSEDELFERSVSDAKDAFNSMLAQTIKKCGKSSGIHFVFIDKNHPPNAIKSSLSRIAQHGSHLDVTTIALTPLTLKQFAYDDETFRRYTYPFSLNLFLTCFDRVQNRKSHETLPGSGVQSAGILFLFFQMFRNRRLTSDSHLLNAFDKQLIIPFSDEENPVEVTPALLDALTDILENTKPGEPCSDEELIEKFIKDYEKAKLDIKNPDKSLIQEHIKKFFDEQIFSELNKNKSNQINIDMDKQEENKSDPNQKGSQGPYNPKRVPTYIGIFATEKNISKDITKHVTSALTILDKKFPGDKELISCLEQMKANKSSFDVIKDPHVTTLFIGSNQQVTNSQYYYSFEEGLKMNIEIAAIAIVPGKIVTGICFPDQSVIKIENQFPHVTLMKGSWQPKSSNDLLIALCDKGGPLEQEWKNRFNGIEPGYTYKKEVKVGKNNVTAYVVIPSQFVIPSVTAAHH